ncbi:EIF2B3 [Mytilus edulis]|uniref:Translation initiation factor eIF2B subunit gamma n=1 Tax=Mytilus edulis TaxID=6550 RepID=A0A8S3R8L8_MYTED|nr:EIF2B3 [Mytilus edulis]
MAAGEGSRMTDLTSKCPKALLPVGNMPMIWYPVNMLERAGFEEAIVIVLQSTLNEIQKTLVDIHGVKMKLIFEPIPDNDLGTADSLRNLKGKIKTDVLVISCDLITDLSLHHIANVHRTYNASVTMLLSTVPQQYLDIAPPGVKSRKRSEKDFIGFDERGDRVLFMASEADLEDTVTFRKSVLKRHPFINIKSGLTDCHLYLIKKWVIDYLSTSQSISSIKSELIPYLVKKQFSKPKQEMPNTNQSVISEDTKPDIFSFSSEDPLTKDVQEMSTWIDHQGDMEDLYHDNKIRCYAYIPKILPNIAPKLEITNIHPAATVKNKSQVGSECLVAEGTTLGEKSSVKRAIVGKHCKIGDKCKIANSVIMDYVNILDGCSVTGSIVGSNVHIHEKCEIKDCIVGAGQSLNAMGQFTNEAIVDISW